MGLTRINLELAHPASKWPHLQSWQYATALQAGLEPHHTFLDAGCGPLMLGIKLIEYLDEGNYDGVDIREKVIEVAETVVLDAGLEDKKPGLFVGDMSTWIPERQYDMVWAFSMLHHVEDDNLPGVMHGLGISVASGGQIFANALCGKPYGVNVNTWQGFPTIRRSFWLYKTMFEDLGLQVQQRGEVPGLPGEVWMQAYAP